MDTLRETIQAELGRLRGPGHGQLRIAAPAGTITADLADIERHAVSIERVALDFAAPQAVAPAAQRIAREVQALEPLHVLEAEADLAVLRTAAPATDDAGVGYWEAQVTSSGVTLEHFHKAHAAPDRVAQPAPVWQRTLGELIEQLAAAGAADA